MEVKEAIVLVGGRGTRLRSVVSDRPKPMAEVGGRPFLEWLLLALMAQDVDRVILACGYKSRAISAHFERLDLGLAVDYSVEDQPLGTGGAARLALEKASEGQVLVLNGDSYCPFRVDPMVRLLERKPTGAVMWLTEVADRSRFGTVEIDGRRVVAFQEKDGVNDRGLINAGVYLFLRSTLARLELGRPASLETDLLPGLIDGGLSAVVGQGPFLDIGTPESYLGAGEFLAADLAGLAGGRA